LTANNEREAQQWRAMGWEAIPNEPPAFHAYPLALYLPDPDLPALVVKNEAEARAAALKGYKVPEEAEMAEAEGEFDAQFATVDEEYTANEYPKALYHPDHRLGIPQGFDWRSQPSGHPPRPIAAVPELYPPMTVANLQEEMAARSKGWNLPEMGQKRKLSGAQRRKLARQAVAQEIAPS
jgi:hypothetical protein